MERSPNSTERSETRSILERDPEYAGELEHARGWDRDPDRHPELIVLTRLEEAGIYLRHRLLLGDALLDFDAILILQSWDPRVWSNAEYLYKRAWAVRSR